MSKKYFILILTLICLINTGTINASTNKIFPEFNISQPSATSPIDFFKELRQSVNDSKLSILPYRPNQNEFKTYLFFAFIFAFFILLLIKLSSADYFSDLFTSFFKKNYFFSKNQKSKFNISFNSIFLDVIFFITISYFFFQYLYTRFELEYYLILGGLIFFTSFQLLIILFSYKLFFGSGNINVHLSNFVLSNRIIGIIFTPLLFIITYLDRAFQPIGLNILLFTLISIILVRIYRIFDQLKIIYNFSFLFIFLYICTFELSIYFVCFKIVLLFFNS